MGAYRRFGVRLSEPTARRGLATIHHVATIATRVHPGWADRAPLAGAAFLALADTGVVALALPPILVELDTTVAGVAAVLGVYALVLAAALPLAERTRAAVGTRAVAAVGIALFAGGALVCGLADSLSLLLAARGVEAAGGAALLVSSYALIGHTDAGARGWRLALLLGTAAGPAIGGALTQAFGWRSIFLLQAPAVLLALPAYLRAPAERKAAAPEPEAAAPPAERGHAADAPLPLGRALALALLSGAIAAALFLTVLLLVSGWSVEPLAAAAAVSTMPLAALAATRIRGPAASRAAGGSLLVAAGTASLAFVPTASVAWTLIPQVLVGVGMGLALPAIAGELLPESSGRHAAALLSIRHAGIALALVLLAPIAQHELDTTLDSTKERGVAVILDAPIDPRTKLGLGPELADSVQSEDPRGGLDEAFAEHRDDVDDDDLAAYDDLRQRADETLVAGVNDGFSVAFLVGGGLALLAALALASREAVSSPRLAVAAVAGTLLVPAAYGLVANTARPPEVTIADPCDDRDLPGSGGVAGVIQDAAMVALDRVACKAGSSREELVLAVVDDDAAKRYEKRYGLDPRSALDLARVALGG
jgi:predicted MFS family arabinose efflux permease